ncbi:MAG TPA: STAS domain-containing protein [Terriglobia bacterium]|nr:STAS domain-containing protein [Terriglobia bacterium]
MPLHVVEKLMGDVLVLDVRGRITLGRETEVLRRQFQDVVDAGHRRIILNLAGVDYVDSAGLGALVAGSASIRKAGGDLKLANLTDRIRGLIQITRLSTLFEVYDNLEKARSAFGPASSI